MGFLLHNRFAPANKGSRKGQKTEESKFPIEKSKHLNTLMMKRQETVLTLNLYTFSQNANLIY